MPTKYAFFVSKSELYRIMSTVRNKILDWALLLEENGIVGNEMTFTDVEKQIAIDTPIINNYINNFYSKVSDVDMKQGQYIRDTCMIPVYGKTVNKVWNLDIMKK